MFEEFSRRVEQTARRRAKMRAGELATGMRAAVPRGIEVEVVEDGVRLSGRGLLRRFLLDPTLRWLALRLR